MIRFAKPLAAPMPSRRRVAPSHSSKRLKMKCLVYTYVCAALASLATTAQAGGAVELSEDNFGKKVAGKNAFVKFLAPVGSIE
jgi:hypothetical protein